VTCIEDANYRLVLERDRRQPCTFDDLPKTLNHTLKQQRKIVNPLERTIMTHDN